MIEDDTPDPGAPGGVWNAYVARGDSKTERQRRLAQCPERLRPSVASHVETVFALRRYFERREREKREGK
jgi:hypothetical protein